MFVCLFFIKCVATCDREAAGNFSSRNLPLCRGKPDLTVKQYVQKNVIGAVTVGASGET